MVVRPFIILHCCACWDRAGYKGSVTVCVVVMSVTFAADTVGPELVLVMLEHGLACLLIM